ncbi:MAG: MBL fold metallo-hydrolase [Ruminococcaceae bacterium]|nr:MBL fold metallo-hydrolase [Oscillospiraceae bacterium]
MDKLKTIVSVILVFAVVLCLSYCLLIEFAEHTVTSPDDDSIHVHFIDVGQGDCALIQSSHGNILIDAGTFDSRFDIVDYVDSLDVTTFEYAIFTHPHEDHIGAAKTLLKEYDVKNIIMPDAVHTTPTFQYTIESIEKENCEVYEAVAGDSYSVGDIRIDIFAPGSYYDTNDLNNMSVVCKVTYGEVSFLFTGDAEEESEDSMRYYGYDLDCDILKVAHHGSSTSSTPEFINAVSPEVAIVSAGLDNDYGHPHRETRQLFSTLGIKTYITYETGNVVIATNGKNYTIKTEK